MERKLLSTLEYPISAFALCRGRLLYEYDVAAGVVRRVITD